MKPRRGHVHVDFGRRSSHENRSQNRRPPRDSTVPPTGRSLTDRTGFRHLSQKRIRVTAPERGTNACSNGGWGDWWWPNAAPGLKPARGGLALRKGARIRFAVRNLEDICDQMDRRYSLARGQCVLGGISRRCSRVLPRITGLGDSRLSRSPPEFGRTGKSCSGHAKSSIGQFKFSTT